MEKLEIVSGLKNALDRGYSLEIAIQSFLNAGYSKQDVEDSAKALGYHGGIISHAEILHPIAPEEKSKEEPVISEIEAPKPMPSSLPTSQAEVIHESWLKANWKILLLSIILLILLGFLFWMIFLK